MHPRARRACRSRSRSCFRQPRASVDALERWKAVLDEQPDHPQAIAAVEAALDDLDLRLMAADILRPVYDGTSQSPASAQLQRTRGRLGG